LRVVPISTLLYADRDGSVCRRYSTYLGNMRRLQSCIRYRCKHTYISCTWASLDCNRILQMSVSGPCVSELIAGEEGEGKVGWTKSGGTHWRGNEKEHERDLKWPGLIDIRDQNGRKFEGEKNNCSMSR